VRVHWIDVVVVGLMVSLFIFTLAITFAQPTRPSIGDLRGSVPTGPTVPLMTVLRLGAPREAFIGSASCAWGDAAIYKDAQQQEWFEVCAFPGTDDPWRRMPLSKWVNP
jgi:hypothetical protein